LNISWPQHLGGNGKEREVGGSGQGGGVVVERGVTAKRRGVGAKRSKTRGGTSRGVDGKSVGGKRKGGVSGRERSQRETKSTQLNSTVNPTQLFELLGRDQSWFSFGALQPAGSLVTALAVALSVLLAVTVHTRRRAWGLRRLLVVDVDVDVDVDVE